MCKGAELHTNGQVDILLLILCGIVVQVRCTSHSLSDSRYSTGKFKAFQSGDVRFELRLGRRIPCPTRQFQRDGFLRREWNGLPSHLSAWKIVLKSVI